MAAPMALVLSSDPSGPGPRGNVERRQRGAHRIDLLEAAGRPPSASWGNAPRRIQKGERYTHWGLQKLPQAPMFQGPGRGIG